MAATANRHLELAAFRAFVVLASMVPIAAGGMGIVLGANFFGLFGDADANSHVHYLSGLLLAIGLSYWACLGLTRTATIRLRTLTFIVVTGGVARLAAAVAFRQQPAAIVLFSLVMELPVTSLAYLWHLRLMRCSAKPRQSNAHSGALVGGDGFEPPTPSV